MALLVKQAGLKLRVVRSNGLYLVRMYTSFRGIFRGWSRIFFGTFCTMKRLTLSLTALVVTGLTPYAAAILGLALAGAGASPATWWWACGIAGCVSAALQITVAWRFYQLAGARRTLAWTYLLGCLIAIFAVIAAMTKLRSGAKVVWRGTSYSRT